ncbi:MAG: alpha/beta hydrolase [Solirubrobacterales bacterium]
MSTSTTERLASVLLGLGASLLFLIPDRWLRLIFGNPGGPAEGLRADALAVGRIVGIMDRGVGQQSVARMRAETDLLSTAVAAARPRSLEIKEFDLDSGDEGPLPARLYVPPGAPAEGPLLVFFHGGGWAVGSIKSHDRACGRLAHDSGVKVLSVEYRLAPEHPFPAAPDDGLRAWRAVVADPARFGAKPGQIAVGGDSAGGNMAAVLCHDLKKADEPQPKLQLLIYPVTEVGSRRTSMLDFAKGFYLTSERMDRFSEMYVGGADCSEPRLSPIHEKDPSGLAPAWVLTALADPLRDEGEEYAKRLAEAGVWVRSDRLPLIHAWFNMTRSRSSRAAHLLLAEGLADLMASPGPLPVVD